MNESTKRVLASSISSMFKVLYFLFPLPVAWVSLSLMSTYLEYHDMGINSVANNGFLVYIVAPALLAVLYITAAASLYLANRFIQSQWRGILLGTLLVFMLGVGAFMTQVQSLADYPTEEPQNLTSFLTYYAREIGTKRSCRPFQCPW